MSDSRIIIYDRTQGWLTLSWVLGAVIAKLLGRVDRVVGVSNWDEFFDACRAMPKLARIEYWGHGHRGGVTCGAVQMNHGSAQLSSRLLELTKFVDSNTLLWWRTCSSFAGKEGHQFALQCSLGLGCRVAGHTFTIWVWQAGLRILKPNETPLWSPEEGISEGKNRWSWPWSPASIFCLSAGPK